MNFTGSNFQQGYPQYPQNLQMYPGQFQQQQVNYQYQQWNAQNFNPNTQNWGMPMNAYGMNMPSQSGNIGTVVNPTIKSEVPSNHENVLPKSKKSGRSEWESDDETLPRNWKKRYFEKNASGTKSGKVKMFEYLSPSNQIYTARSKMVQHLKEDGRYSQEVINKVEKARATYNGSNQNSVNSSTGISQIIPQGSIPKLPKKSENQTKELLKTTSNSSKSIFSEWETDSFLPFGWKKRSFETGNKNSKTGKMTKYQFLSPAEEIIPSRSQVIEYMIKSGTYSEDDILQVKKGHGRNKRQINKINESSMNEENPWENSNYSINNISNSVDSDLGSSINTTSDLESFNNSSVDFQDAHNYSNRSEQINLLGKLTKVSFTKIKDSSTIESASQIANGLSLAEDMKTTVNVLENFPNIAISKVNPVVNSLPNISISKVNPVVNSLPNISISKVNPVVNSLPNTSISNVKPVVNVDISNTDKLVNTLVKTEKSLKNNLNSLVNIEINNSTKPAEKKRKRNERSDWQDEEALPNNWKRRSYENTWNKNGEIVKFTKYEYLSPSGKLFNTRISVMAHMEEFPAVYSENQVLKFKNSLRRAVRNPKSFETIGKSQEFKEIQIDKDQVPCRTESDDSKTNIANLSTNQYGNVLKGPMAKLVETSIATDRSRKQFMCNLCGIGYYLQDHLNTHITRHHAGNFNPGVQQIKPQDSQILINSDESYDQSEKVNSLEKISHDFNDTNQVDSPNIMDHIEASNIESTKERITKDVGNYNCSREEVNNDGNTEELSINYMNNTEESVEDFSSEYDANDSLELLEESIIDYDYGMVWSSFMDDSEEKFEDYNNDKMNNIEDLDDNFINDTEQLLDISSNTSINDIEEHIRIHMNHSEVTEKLLDVSTNDCIINSEENFEESSIKINPCESINEHINDIEDTNENMNETEETNENINETEDTNETNEYMNETEETNENINETEDTNEYMNETEETNEYINESEETNEYINESEETNEYINESEETNEYMNESEETNEYMNESEETNEYMNESEETNEYMNESEETNEYMNESEETNENINETEEPNENMNEIEETNENINVTEDANEYMNETEETNKNIDETEDNNENINETQETDESGIVVDLIGPSISMEVSDFSMLSLLFTKNPNPKRSEIEDMSEDMEMSSKDVKWTFIKLREKFQTKKGKPVDTEAVKDFVELIKMKFGKNTVTI